MIVREFTVHMLHERANNERSRGNRGTSGIINCRHLVAPSSCLSRMKRTREREKKRKIFFPRVHYRATANCLLSVRRGQIFVASSDFLVGRKTRSARISSRRTGQKGPWNPGARCHRHSHRSHPIIFKLSKRALRPYIRLDVSCVCEHVSK